MTKFFITTFNKRLYDDYANHFIRSYIQTKPIIPLTCYIEESKDNYPQHPLITYINLFEVMPKLVEFKERNKHRPVTSFYEDAIKFSHKVFAQAHASLQNEKFIWLDADNVFVKPWTELVFDNFILDNIFTRYYERQAQYTECGILGFNSTKIDISKKFFEIYLENFDEFKKIFRLCCQTHKVTPKENKELSNLNGKVLTRDKYKHLGIILFKNYELTDNKIITPIGYDDYEQKKFAGEYIRGPLDNFIQN